MSRISEQVAEIVREAIDLEANAKIFYELAATVTEHERGKAMFERLAREESGHMDEVGEIITALTGGEDWREAVDEDSHTVRPSAIVESFKETVAHWIGNKKTADETVALRMAMELERRAIHYFEGLARMSDDPKVHAMAERLVEEERYHYDLLQTQYDNILNVGVWVDGPEFRMDGKF